MTTRGSEAPPGPVTVAFANEGDFLAWHDAKCLELGIPYHGENLATGEPVPVWTTAYTDPWFVENTYVCVTLPADEIAADPVLKSLEVIDIKYSEGVPSMTIEVPAPFEYRKPIPEVG